MAVFISSTASRARSVCMKRACPLGHDCLAVIKPEQVEEKLKALVPALAAVSI